MDQVYSNLWQYNFHSEPLQPNTLPLFQDSVLSIKY